MGEDSFNSMIVQVAIYALLTSAIEVELLLSHDRSNESSVRKM